MDFNTKDMQRHTCRDHEDLGKMSLLLTLNNTGDSETMQTAGRDPVLFDET